ncbi:hypothetical protein N7504_005542 [Penicillium tannophilum]|nr:hypothetical protein N7504_005542 [Penicillium tannophilum]
MPLETGLQGTHVLITGGTRGMGQTMVRHFLQEGANVSYCARTVTNAEFDEVHQSLPASNSARAFGTAFDVYSKEAIVKWVNSSADRVGRIDVIIANASPIHMEGETEHWESSFAIDVMGFVELVKAAEPYLEKSPQASIIAAQLQHVQELSHHLGPKGIRVNAISPGPIVFEGGIWDQSLKLMPEWVEEQRVKIPLKRLGGPQEISNVAVFLASPLASFVTGTNLLVDGGIHVGTQF